jgi:hypothetical protein
MDRDQNYVITEKEFILAFSQKVDVTCRPFFKYTKFMMKKMQDDF